MRMRHIVTWRALLYNIFPRFLKRYDFWKKNGWTQIVFFDFLFNLLEPEFYI